MSSHKIAILFIALIMQVSSTCAQTVRFDTSLGRFDIELFPNEAPLTVANFLSYVTSGRYDNTVINRSETNSGNNFVVQMGLFSSITTSLPPDRDGFIDILKDPPVQDEPAQTNGLSNILGTVGLARSAEPNSGTSSFFVNGADNSFLDPQFAVFGRVTNMNTINDIFAAPQFDGRDMYEDSLHFSNIPLQQNGDMVIINAARVIPEPASICLAYGAVITMLFSRDNRTRVRVYFRR